MSIVRFDVKCCNFYLKMKYTIILNLIQKSNVDALRGSSGRMLMESSAVPHNAQSISYSW